jgi:hypothetical protein
MLGGLDRRPEHARAARRAGGLEHSPIFTTSRDATDIAETTPAPQQP